MPGSVCLSARSLSVGNPKQNEPLATLPGQCYNGLSVVTQEESHEPSA